MSVEKITTISPTTNQPVVVRNGLSNAEIEALPKVATEAFLSFKKTTISERQAIVKKALKLLTDKQDELAKELTEQMGRPIAYTAKEITTAVARGEYLLKISGDSLKDTEGEPEKGFRRFIRKEPIGPVLIIFAWNVSSFLPAEQPFTFSDSDTTVSVPHPREFSHPGPACWKFGHHQTLTTNSNYSRTSSENLSRGRASRECHSILSLRFPVDFGVGRSSA